MKRRIAVLAAAFMLSLSALAQEKTPTVEEIYAKYLSAIGGNEKINNIENKLDVSLLSTEYIATGAVSNQGASTQQIINFWDYANAQSATVVKQFPSELTGDKTTFTRSLNANGKTTILLPDGKRHESASLHTGFEDTPVPETTMPAGAKLLPNERFNSKEVYVVNYEKTTLGTPFNYTAYFDVGSGLLVGLKQLNKNESFGSTITTDALNTYEEYKEVGGILIPHNTKQAIKSETTGELNMTTITNVIIETIAVEFNIDAETFKNGCFQNPQECFD